MKDPAEKFSKSIFFHSEEQVRMVSGYPLKLSPNIAQIALQGLWASILQCTAWGTCQLKKDLARGKAFSRALFCLEILKQKKGRKDTNRIYVDSVVIHLSSCFSVCLWIRFLKLWLKKRCSTHRGLRQGWFDLFYCEIHPEGGGKKIKDQLLLSFKVYKCWCEVLKFYCH